jgi:arylsulfatase A-like enzyme
VAAHFTRALYGLAGAAVGAGIASVIESCATLQIAGGVNGRALFDATSAEFGVVVPLALAIGSIVAGASLFLEPDEPLGPFERVSALRREPLLARSRTAALAPLVGIAATAWIVLTAHAARWSLSAGRPIASGVTLGVIATLSLVALGALVSACVPPIRRGLASVASRWPRAVDPATTGTVGLVVLVGVVSIGASLGDTGGEGPTPLAIFGVLRRRELDLRPLANGLLVALCAWAGLLRARGRAGFSRPLVALLIVAGSIGLTVHEASALERDPGPARAIELYAPLGRIALALDRSLTDRDHDGASPYFGGGDCDDANPRISPFAIDVPGNGIDEDCSGADSPLVSHADAVRAAPRVPALARGDANLILVTIDALRASEVGFLGYDKATTPNLDALAAGGAVFERAYAMASYTGKALAPMLIGKYPSETRRDGNHFNRYFAGNTFLAERLHDAGIFTMGAATHWYFRDFFGLTQGFDVFDGSAIPPAGQGDSDTNSTSPQLTDVALKLLAAHASAGRFFLWLHYFDPHAQYVPHAGAPDYFDAGGDRMRALYDGEVWFTDRAIGRLLDFVRAQPWASRTIVAVTSDHGEAMNEHGMGYKHGFEIWEPLVRVPLVIIGPGIAPHRVPEKRSAVDLVPTLLDLMAVALPPRGELSGESMVDDLALPPRGGYAERDVYIDMPEGPFTHMRRAILHGPTPGLKLIHFGGRQYQLYDLAGDPGEMHDLASDSAKLAPMLDAFSAKRQTVAEIYVAPEGGGP